MCDPITAIALGLSAASGGAGVAGAASTRHANAAAQDAETQTSAHEFDTRESLARDIFKENTGISRDMYDKINGLSDEEFQKRTGLSKDAFAQLDQVARDQITRDATAATGNTAAIRGIRTARDAARDAASNSYDKTLADANTVQDNFRGQGDAVSQELLAAFTPGAMVGRQVAGQSARDALVGRTVSPQDAPPEGVSMTPEIRAMYDKYAQESRAKAMAEAAAGSKLYGYTDALQGGDRAINQGGERTAFIRDDARRALAPLASALGVSSLKYNDASDAARASGANADADLESALSLSDTKATGQQRGVTEYTGAMDNAMQAFYGNSRNSADTQGNALLDANNTRLAGSNSVSSNFENQMHGITDFRMANNNTNGWTAASTLLGALSGPLATLGKNRTFAKTQKAA